MGSGLHFILVPFLIIGMWTGGSVAGDSVCKVCPFGWTQFEDYCYKYFNKAMPWVDAENFCISMGANLASVTSQTKFEFINELILTSIVVNTGTWIGGNDAIKEGVYLWTDGSPFEFVLWSKGEPNSQKKDKEDCLELNYWNLFNDADCGMKFRLVCGMKL